MVVKGVSTVGAVIKRLFSCTFITHNTLWHLQHKDHGFESLKANASSKTLLAFAERSTRSFEYALTH